MQGDISNSSQNIIVKFTLVVMENALHTFNFWHVVVPFSVKTGFQVKTIIEATPEVARARLLLFSCAKQVLGEGMEVLGIIPLDQV